MTPAGSAFEPAGRAAAVVVAGAELAEDAAGDGVVVEAAEWQAAMAAAGRSATVGRTIDVWVMGRRSGGKTFGDSQPCGNAGSDVSYEYRDSDVRSSGAETLSDTRTNTGSWSPQMIDATRTPATTIIPAQVATPRAAPK